MNPDVDGLSAWLSERDVDGYLLDASGSDPDQRYLTAFGSPDPFVSLVVDGEIHLLVRGLDRALAKQVSTADSVVGPEAFDGSQLYEEFGRTEGEHQILLRFLESHEVSSVSVPPRFPVARADALRQHGIEMVSDHEGIIATLREIKGEQEIDAIGRTQQATEVAMRRAETCLAEAEIIDDELYLDGTPLTSERLKQEIGVALIRNDCRDEDTIASCGTDAADPHHRGAGPLKPDAPIVIDIFPRHTETHFHADMTRTFCVGSPPEPLAEWYELTCAAQDAAFELIEPGVTGEAIHDAVCDVYEAADIPTGRSDPGSETGFVHGTGHGVGLSVHEGPRVSSGGRELQPGHVITIEPGVYDPSVGGIRIEDLVVVTEDGFENLTDYPREFRIV